MFSSLRKFVARRFQAGFVRVSPVGSNMRDVDQWKTLVLVLVVLGVVSAITTPNFDEVVVGNGSSYGVKAALCALGAATLAFTSVIPGGGVEPPSGHSVACRKRH